MNIHASQGQIETSADVALSVITPIYNEEQNIFPLMDALVPVLRGLRTPFEIIAVNDGSRDGSLARLREASARWPELRVVNFRRNFGQTAAIMAGFDHARGETIITIDADLQNDPADVPRLLGKLEEGYDVVSGWRANRQDHRIRRVAISRAANAIISRLSGVRLNDYGCTMKAYRRDVLKEVRLYGEMHRFIPIFASWMGARIAELPVNHNARRHGKSNYGLERILKVTLDLMVVKFLDRYFAKPIYVFGGFGIFAIACSFGAFSWAVYLKLVEGISFISTPLLLLTVLTFLVGFISLLMGLLAEMIVRTYFESQGRAAYFVQELINFPRAD